MRLCVIVISLLGLVSSCAFQQEIHFNEDWSGNVKYTIDLSAMKALTDGMEDPEGSEEEEPESLIEKDDMQSALESLEQIEGISNAYAIEDEELGIYVWVRL